jgi:hypothetical protein
MVRPGATPGATKENSMHSVKPRRVECWLLAMTASLLLVVSGSQAAEEEAFVATETLTKEDSVYVSRSGQSIVVHIGNARAALDRGDWMRARFETGKARAILGRVREKSPRLNLRDRIAAALQDLGSGSKPKAEALLPIYAALDVVKKSEDITDVRAYVDKAKAGAAAGDAGAVEDNLVEASARIRYLEIDLPIEETYSRLTRTLFQITEKDLLSASATLRDAAQHIQTVVEIASSSEEEEDLSAVSAAPE